MRKIFEGNPWWVANEVCHILGIASTQTRRLDDDEKGLHLMQTHGGKQQLQIVNECGLYTLILGSRKKQAMKFKRWIIHDVLPMIRKTGSYSIKPKSLLDWMRQAVKSEEKAVMAIKEANIAKKETKKLRPKADALKTLANCEGFVSLMVAGKLLNMKPRVDLIRLLLHYGVLYRSGDANGTLLPYQYYLDHGWFKVKTVGIKRKHTQTFVTQFGLAKMGERFSEYWEKRRI